MSLTKYLISKHILRGALHRVPETYRHGWRLCSGTCFSERMGRGYSAEYDYCRLWVTYCSRRQLGHNFNDHNTAIIRTPKKTLVSVLKILCLKNNMQKNRRGTTICYLHWSQEVFYGPCLTEANTSLQIYTTFKQSNLLWIKCAMFTRFWKGQFHHNFHPFQNL